MKRIFYLLLMILSFEQGYAQELQARFSVQSNKVSSQVDKKAFQTLQTALTNFFE